MPDCACGTCPDCLAAQREDDEFRAWQQTPEGRTTAAYLERRAANGFLPRDPNPELDALLAPK
jgi:hypothetical protein